MYGKAILFYITIYSICVGLTLLILNLRFEEQYAGIPVISIVVLLTVSFMIILFGSLRKISSLKGENKKYGVEFQEKETTIADLQFQLGSLQRGYLRFFSQFGDYSTFKQELDTLNVKIEALCSQCTTLQEAAFSISNNNSSISADVNELLKATSFITENIRKAFDIADNLAASANSAFTISEKLQRGTKLVSTALEETLHSSEILFKQSQQISKILEFLSEISSKINILSINASIVSARAGASGKPFKVVSKEIRKLATETEKSLNQISADIININQLITNVVSKVKYAAEQTDSEKNALLSVAGSLQGITLGVEVFRAVSKVAKEKSETQITELNSLSQDCLKQEELSARVSELKKKIREIQEINDAVRQNNIILKKRLEKPDPKGG